MRIHVKIIWLALVVNLVLWGGLEIVLPHKVSAQGACANVYIVRRGDWLAHIARQHQTSVSVLMQLNPALWWNPNLIYPGQALCMPGKPPRTLALETTYEYAPQVQIPVVQGKRVTYTLTEARVVTDTAKLDRALTSTPAPAAVLVKNNNASGYALFEIGTPNLTASTQITPTAALNLTEGCNGVSPVNTVIGSMQALKTTYEFAVERPDGFRVPLDITDVGLLNNPSDIHTCGSERIVAILFPVQNKSDTYWALVPGQELQSVAGPAPWWIYYSFFWGSYSYY